MTDVLTTDKEPLDGGRLTVAGGGVTQLRGSMGVRSRRLASDSVTARTGTGRRRDSRGTVYGIQTKSDDDCVTLTDGDS